MTIDREAMIAEYIDACTECGGRDFPKRSDCDGCIAAVDEYIDKMAQSQADRFSAATRAVAIGPRDEYLEAAAARVNDALRRARMP